MNNNKKDTCKIGVLIAICKVSPTTTQKITTILNKYLKKKLIFYIISMGIEIGRINNRNLSIL
jgi:hypothetical protein